MKIIKTNRFLKKQAQFRDFNLKPGVTDQMVDQQFGGETAPKPYPNQSGEYESKVDWTDITRDLVNSANDVGGLPYFGQGDLVFYYEYDAEEVNGEVNILDIRLLDIKTLMGDKYQSLTVSEPSTKEAIFSGYKDEIAEQEKRIVKEVSQGQPWEPDRTEELY
jgi:hypothetical protein